MKFGLFGAATAQRNANPDVDSAAGFKDYVEYVIEAESLGYHASFIVEHHFTGFGQVSATLNLLTWIGARTTTLRLGTAVLVLPWHNPVLLAEQAATLDLLSGGRLDFGVGKGYRHNEYASFRIPMEDGQSRFEESIDIVTKSWTSNERLPSMASTGSSTTSWSSRRPSSARTRRSGRAPAIRTRSNGSRRAGIICCWINSRPWKKRCDDLTFTATR